MKKIVLSVIVALIAITANAQVYVGGTFGVGSDKVETEGTEVRNTTFKMALTYKRTLKIKSIVYYN